MGLDFLFIYAHAKLSFDIIKKEASEVETIWIMELTLAFLHVSETCLVRKFCNVAN